MTMTWGLILIGMGFIKSWEALLGLRVILGALEVKQQPSERNHVSELTIIGGFLPG